MTPTQFRRALADLGLTQEQAADFLGRGLRTINWWASPKGAGKIPKAEAMLLKLMIRLNLEPEDVK